MLPRSDLWRDYCLWFSVSAHSRLDTENYARVTVSSDVLTTVYIRFQLCNSALTLWLFRVHKYSTVQVCTLYNYGIRLAVLSAGRYAARGKRIKTNQKKVLLSILRGLHSSDGHFFDPFSANSSLSQYGWCQVIIRCTLFSAVLYLVFVFYH